MAFADGVTAILLSDGNQLSILSQGTTGVFLAADGSVSSPSFSFNSDTSTGLYLNGIHDMRVASNGIDIVNFNATNLASVLVDVNGRLNANSIEGGTF